MVLVDYKGLVDCMVFVGCMILVDPDVALDNPVVVRRASPGLCLQQSCERCQPNAETTAHLHTTEMGTVHCTDNPKVAFLVFLDVT